MHSANDALNIGVDSHFGSIDGKGAQILGGSETTRQDQGIEVGGIDGRNIGDVTSSDACRLKENVAALSFDGSLSEMIDHMHLFGIGGHIDGLGAATVDGQERRYSLVHFGTVKPSTP